MKTKLLLFGLFVGYMLTFSSCAEDMDDYIQQKDKELTELNEEDQRIRTELLKQIEVAVADIPQMLRDMKERLEKKIDNSGNEQLTALSNSMSTLNTHLTSKVAETRAYINKNMGKCETDIEAAFVDMENARKLLNTQLAQAIKNGDNDLQERINEMQKLIDIAERYAKKTKANIEGLDDALKVYEAISDTLKVRETQTREMGEKVSILEKQIDLLLQDFAYRYSSEVLTQLTTDQIAVINEKIQKMRQLINEGTGFIGDMDNIVESLDGFLHQAEEVANAIDNDILNEYDSILDEAESLAEEISSIVSDIDGLGAEAAIEEARTKLEEVGAMCEEMTEACEENKTRAEEMFDELDGAREDLNSELEEMRDEVNNVQDLFSEIEEYLN